MEFRTRKHQEFTCEACGTEYDREEAVSECRVCHRTFCDECINEENICVPCEGTGDTSGSVSFDI